MRARSSGGSKTRKIAMLCALLLMVGTLAGCKKTPDTTNPPEQQTPTTTEPLQQNGPYAPKPADGVLSCKRDGKSVAVTVSLPERAGEEVSLIAISDPKYQLSWWENTDACLSDLGQIKLDDKGQGILPIGFRGTLQLYLWDENNRPLAAMQEIAVNAAALSGYNIGAMTAKHLIKEGAILLDVRTHATSGITMEIPEGAKKFLAVAGCDLEKSGGQTMMFFVYIDGIEADHSSLIKIGQHYVFDVDIPEGAKEIGLYAYEGRADGNTNDHADWTVAGFINNPTKG